MRNQRLVLLIVLLSLPLTLVAEERKVEKAKNSTNQTLDSMEKGIKDTAGEAKQGGNGILQSLDDAIHRGWNKIRGTDKPKPEDIK